MRLQAVDETGAVGSKRCNFGLFDRLLFLSHPSFTWQSAGGVRLKAGAVVKAIGLEPV
jgi:hypothetical protein